MMAGRDWGRKGKLRMCKVETKKVEQKLLKQQISRIHLIVSYLHRRNESDSPKHNYVKQVPALKRYFDMAGLFEDV